LISLVPVDTKTDIDHLVELMSDDAKLNGLALAKLPTVNEMTVAQIVESAATLTVIIARRNFSKLTAVRRAEEVLARSNNNVVGVVLLTPTR
jgi:hypothetical protein